MTETAPNAALDELVPDAVGSEDGSEPGREPSELATNLFLGVLVVYVVLLGIGVFAEAFHIQWILSWPIY
jgi:hypothetical protein